MGEMYGGPDLDCDGTCSVCVPGCSRYDPRIDDVAATEERGEPEHDAEVIDEMAAAIDPVFRVKFPSDGSIPVHEPGGQAEPEKYFVCQDCGIVAVGEDGCCVTCGRDAPLKSLPAVAVEQAEPDEQ